ncbi:hypothetical protein [Sphingomonas sanguinis]|jgi:hypothetical protein|uniref:Uncharacterized protein n=1 Tax=Sphingomonas sanguinis TaxID=33051 RepID=A0A7Y7QWB8_9SPHN|nr:hypothetical protein [Sphingomonas sanguinis]MBZ6382266.1 hypothetical protein [Sphingomonas sanguinis]NNG50852.1 hypothetical protein [Sphingomonas sanguinis]NNG54360.1 hypothetical protein [Sphingomonas sanguinis]NVP31564.1 hypothetical protein [Sphingomonas sanguinis]
MAQDSNATPLWVTLANAAIVASGDEPQAVSALMHAAAAILDRRFGSVEASRLIREIALDAEAQIVGGSGIVATKH